MKLMAAALNKMDYMAVAHAVGAGSSRNSGRTQYRGLDDAPGAEHGSDSL